MNSAQEIVASAHSGGVELRVEGGRIRWRATGPLDDDLAAAIRANRDAIVGELRRQAATEEAELIERYARREAVARAAARVRSKLGTGWSRGQPARVRDSALADGASIAEALRLAELESA